MPRLALEILYEDNHLLVVNKPAGIATMGAESGATVHSLAADYLKSTYNKPGRAYVGIVSRLDSMTSGVLVLARTSKAASRLSAQLAEKSQDDEQTSVRKIYLAALQGRLESEQGLCVDLLRKDDAARRMRVVHSPGADVRQARLRYVSVGQSDDITIVAIELLTGRKHQIRVQFSDLGHPVVGDRKYGSTRHFANGVALHSWRLQIIHPTKREPMWFTADPPRSWKSLQRIMPGDSELQRRSAEFLHFPTNDDRE